MGRIGEAAAMALLDRLRLLSYDGNLNSVLRRKGKTSFLAEKLCSHLPEEGAASLLSTLKGLHGVVLHIGSCQRKDQGKVKKSKQMKGPISILI